MIKPPDQKGAPGVRAGRLRENFKIADRMAPYANRLQLRLAHFEVSDSKKKQQLTDARDEMMEILTKKKIRQDEARRAVAQTLDIAADHQFEPLRREHNVAALQRSQEHLDSLIKQLDQFAQAIAKLPPLAKGKLNKIIAKQNWQNFDTEAFNALVEVMAGILSESSPACTAQNALRAINEKVRSASDPAVARIIRTAPPALIDLWDTIPAETRIQVEAGLRGWKPPTRSPAVAFLHHLIRLLGKYQPRLKRGPSLRPCSGLVSGLPGFGED